VEKEQYKVSVIVTIYNSEKYLEKCLDSIVKQSYSNIEIILVDDASKDSSIQICNKFQKEDERIKIIQKGHMGVSGARNAGIENATGEYILFVDSDDWIDYNTIKYLIDIYNKNKNTDIILFGIKKYYMSKILEPKLNLKNNEKLEEKEYNLDEILPELIEYEKINSPVNKIYKTEIIKKQKIRFDVNIEIAEDLLFNIHYFKNINNVYILNREFYNYRIENENSLTHKYIENKYEQLIFVNKEMEKWINQLNNKNLQYKCKYIKFKNIVSCIRSLSHKKCNYAESEKKQYLKNIKKNNKFIIVKTINYKIFILSCIYSCLPIGLFEKLCNYKR